MKQNLGCALGTPLQCHITNAEKINIWLTKNCDNIHHLV